MVLIDQEIKSFAGVFLAVTFPWN